MDRPQTAASSFDIGIQLPASDSRHLLSVWSPLATVQPVAERAPAAPSPLADVRVVDVSSYVTGPFAAMMLGDLGADVVKIEPPGGDPNRRFGHVVDGNGMLFANTNRAKRSIVLDLKVGADLAALESMLASADVLVENWRPGVADRLGLSDRRLAELNPRLIQLSITGYGADGPLGSRGAFDSAVQALSGLAWHNQHGGVPELTRSYLVDKTTATFAVQGVLAALLQRARTGEGLRVDVNMLATAAYFNFPDVFEARTVVSDTAAVKPEANPGSLTLIPTADGHIVVAPSSGSHVRRACDAVGHPEWIGDLKTLRGFEQLAPELMARLASVTVSESTAHWVAAFELHDVPVAPVLDLDGHLEHPQVVHNAIYRTVEHHSLGPMRAPEHPVVLRSGVTEPARQTTRPFPDLDEHGGDRRWLTDRV